MIGYVKSANLVSLIFLPFRMVFFSLTLLASFECQSSKADTNNPLIRINNELGIDLLMDFKKVSIRQDDPNFKFGYDIKLPVFVGKDVVIKELNAQIRNAFADLLSPSLNVFHFDSSFYRKVSFEYVLHDSQLSLIIQDQRDTYPGEAVTSYLVVHADVELMKVITTVDVFEKHGLSRLPVLSAFADQCVMPDESAEPLFDTFWFERVKWQNLNELKFFVRGQNQLIIIYPVASNGIEDLIMLN